MKQKKTPTIRKEPLPLAGLRFATYSRKSNEDDRTEDHKSVARQVDQATRWVEQRGGVVLPDHIYSDEDISGAEFRERRGLLRFLDSVKNGRPFAGVVMSEQSRLGREQLETGYLLKQIRDAGCRVFYYLTGEEAKLDSALDKIMSSLTSFAAEMEREKAKQRSRDAAERKSRQGHVTGGEPFGYQNIRMKGDRPVEPGEQHDYVARRVNEDEAKIVRGIFQAYADGWGLLVIAKTLNGLPQYEAQRREFFGGQIPPPPSARSGAWQPMTIRYMLRRELYRGVQVWGQTTQVDRDGRAGLTVRRDAAEWLRVPVPAVRIVSDELWESVQKQLAATDGTYLRDGRGRLWGKPDRAREGHYLLSGLACCTLCGGKIAVLGGINRLYGCVRHKYGTCENGLTQRVPLVDTAFLDTLAKEMLIPERFRYAVRCGVERVREQLRKEPNRGAALEREKATLVRRISKLVDAIGDGKGPAALVQEIAKAEARIKEIEVELARLAAGPALVAVDLGRIEEAVAGQLSRFADLLKGNVPRARQLLKKVLVDQVEFTPLDLQGGQRTYKFEGRLAYGAVLREVIYMEKKPEGISIS
jgi:DNA invertase Pin-like site-specific DNA recombinase